MESETGKTKSCVKKNKQTKIKTKTKKQTNKKNQKGNQNILYVYG